MKASELMIGDYIVSDLGKIYRVKGVRDWDGGEVLVSTGKADMWYDYRLIKPIPLTEDILKVNGFEHPKFEDGTEVKYIMAYDKDGLMWLNKEEDYFFISSSDAYIHIYFVHELQHALRLCGLNDLAENFKVTADGVTTNASAQNITD